MLVRLGFFHNLFKSATAPTEDFNPATLFVDVALPMVQRRSPWATVAINSVMLNSGRLFVWEE